MNKSSINFKKVFPYSMLILTSVVGAGLVTGREVTAFFGDGGRLNILMFMLIFLGLTFFIYFTAKFGKEEKTKSLYQLSDLIFKKTSKIFKFIFLVFIFFTMSIMIAGIDALSKTLIFESSFPYVTIIVSLLVIFIISRGLKSVLRLSSFLFPIVLILLFVSSLSYFIFFKELAVDISNPSEFDEIFRSFYMTVLYIGGILIIPVALLAQNEEGFNKKESFFMAIIFSFLFTLIISLVTIAIFSSNNDIFLADVPMVLIAKEINSFLHILYTGVVFLAISLAFMSNAFTIKKIIDPYFNNKKMVTPFLIVSSGFIFSRVGFGVLIDYVYPIRGLFGIVFLVCFIIYVFSKNSKKFEISNNI